MLIPADIERKRFTSSFRGYDQGEVDDFIDAVHDTVVELYRRLQDSEDRTQVMKSQATVTVEGASRLLAAAEAAATKCKEEAQAEAEALVEQGRRSAQSQIDGATQEASRIVSEGTAERHRQIGELEEQRATLKQRLDELTRAEEDVLVRLRKALEGWNG